MKLNQRRRNKVRYVTFKHVFEEQMTWTLDNSATVTTPKAFDPDQNWLPLDVASNHIDFATYDTHKYHVLKRVKMTMDNFRVFIADSIKLGKTGDGGTAGTAPWSDSNPPVPCQGSGYPPSRSFNIQELKRFRLWFYRCTEHDNLTSPNTVPSPQEEQYTPIWSNKTFTHTIYFGKMRKMNMESCTASDLVTNFKDLKDYCEKFQVTGRDGQGSPAAVPTLAHWILPDDPYPANVYGGGNVTSTLTVVCDRLVESTFAVFKEKPGFYQK